MKIGSKKARKRAVAEDSEIEIPAARIHLQEAVDKLNKKYGAGTICFASQAVNMNLGFISTGNMRLDFELGGGVAINRIMEVFGRESAGKTTFLLKTIAEFHKQFPEGVAAFIDFEHTFERSYAEALGVDCSRVLLIDPNDGEQGINLLFELLQLGLDILIGVDSIAAIVATSTMEADAEKAQVGVQARLVNRMLAVCNARMKRRLDKPDAPTTTVILLNQIREKVGVMFGDPTTTPGGLGKNFFCSMRLRLYVADGKANREYVETERQGVKKSTLVARKFSFQAVKNKCGGDPFAEGEYMYYVRPHRGYSAFSLDNADAIIEYGRFHEVITLRLGKKKSSCLAYNEVELPEDAFREKLIEDADFAAELRTAILEKLAEVK